MAVKTLMITMLILITIMGELNIATYNCRGAMSSYPYIDKLLSSADILCLQEHHLCNETKEFLNTINTDFDVNVVLCNENANNLESKLRKGGIAILWKKSLGYCISDVVLGFTTDRIMTKYL